MISWVVTKPDDNVDVTILRKQMEESTVRVNRLACKLIKILGTLATFPLSDLL